MKTTTSQETLNYERGMSDGFKHHHRSPHMLAGVIGIRSKLPGWSDGFKEAIELEQRKEAANGTA